MSVPGARPRWRRPVRAGLPVVAVGGETAHLGAGARQAEEGARRAELLNVYGEGREGRTAITVLALPGGRWVRAGEPYLRCLQPRYRRGPYPCQPRSGVHTWLLTGSQ